MRRPAARASTLRRASTAGIAALPGMPTPSDSTIEAMVDAVPMVMQWPCERCMHDSASWNSSRRDLAGAQVLRHRPDVGARADVGAAVLAREHRPARHDDGRQVDARRAHQQSPAWSCRSRRAAPRRRAGWRGSIPRRPCWRGCGRASRSAAAASRRATSPGTRAGSRRPRARPPCTCSASTRKCELQGISSDLGVADADHRAAVELVLRHAAVLHPAAVDEAVDVLPPEPLDGALPAVFLFH